MHRIIKTAALLLIGLLLGTAGSALADQSKDFGDFVVHYNALSTDFLNPTTAKAYDIKRSKNRAMLTVTVLKKNMGLAGQPVKASVNARAVNLNHQVKSLKMREIVDAGAIYYIADFRVANRETLDFTIEATPQGGTPKTVTFRQQFFTN